METHSKAEETLDKSTRMKRKLDKELASSVVEVVQDLH